METYFLFPIHLLNNLNIVWSFFLMVVRYTAVMAVIPGLGTGYRGMPLRLPGILIMAYASVLHGPYAAMPKDYVDLITGSVSEILFGVLLGSLPAMVIAGAQTAAQLSTTTMGLGAAQLFDPSLGISVTSVGRLFGDLFICVFLLLGGHHAVLYVTSGLGGTIVPGTFLINEQTIGMFVARVGDIFVAGVMISAPVIVAILLTNFVMGLISRAVPQVNIFIINFPLTIGIGLVLTMLSLPEIVVYLEKDFARMEQEMTIVVGATQRVSASVQEKKTSAQPERSLPLDDQS